jgi:transketolase
VLADAPGGTPEAILIASGSEVSLALSANEALRRRRRDVNYRSHEFPEESSRHQSPPLPPGSLPRRKCAATRWKAASCFDSQLESYSSS